MICFPFDHELRKKINANWHITKPAIKDSFYTKQQKAMAQEIVRKVLSEDGYQRVLKQTEYDDGGLESYSMAMFGTPESGKFEWTLTGRHLTFRADGNSVDNAAFGGPLIYGHGEEDPGSEFLYLFQTKQTNEVFKASLDAGKQACQSALVEDPTQRGRGSDSGEKRACLPWNLCRRHEQRPTATGRTDVEGSIARLIVREDADEVMEMLKAQGGVGKLHMAFYQTGDLKNDSVWDIWRVEGQSFVWHFRGAPHVHAYINIGMKV